MILRILSIQLLGSLSNEWFPDDSSIFKDFDSTSLALLIGQKRTLFQFIFLSGDL